MNTLTNFRIDEATRKSFHIWCIQNDTTIAENLRSHIKDTLAVTKQSIQSNNGWFTDANKRDIAISGRWEDSF